MKSIKIPKPKKLPIGKLPKSKLIVKLPKVKNPKKM
jgi:hypothetical protein